MVNEFILAWVLVTANGSSLVTYSPPVATLADCQRIAQFVGSRSRAYQCIQVNVLKGK